MQTISAVATRLSYNTMYAAKCGVKSDVQFSIDLLIFKDAQAQVTLRMLPSHQRHHGDSLDATCILTSCSAA